MLLSGAPAPTMPYPSATVVILPGVECLQLEFANDLVVGRDDEQLGVGLDPLYVL